jgi:hypothetical protein
MSLQIIHARLTIIAGVVFLASLTTAHAEQTNPTMVPPQIGSGAWQAQQDQSYYGQPNPAMNSPAPQNVNPPANPSAYNTPPLRSDQNRDQYGAPSATMNNRGYSGGTFQPQPGFASSPYGGPSSYQYSTNGSDGVTTGYGTGGIGTTGSTLSTSPNNPTPVNGVRP